MSHRRGLFFLSVGICLVFVLKPGSTEKAANDPRGIPDSLRHVLTDDLATWQAPEWIEKEYPYSLSGYDCFNRPIWALDFAKWDILKVIKKGGQDFADFDRHFRQYFYRLLASRIRTLTIPTRMPVNSVNESAIVENEAICLYDMKDYPASQVASPRVVSYLINKAKELKRAYDYVKVVYGVNVSKPGRLLIDLLKPTVADVFHKAEIYGTDEKEWMPVLQRNLPRYAIPYKYGGYSNHTSIMHQN